MVKVARQGHDMRYDIPVVGLYTLAVLKIIKAIVLAVEAHKTILLEKEKVVEVADRQELALIAVKPGRYAKGDNSLITIKRIHVLSRQSRFILFLVVLAIGVSRVCFADSISTQLVGWAVGGTDSGYATILYTTNSGDVWVRQGSIAEIADVPLSCVAAVDAQMAWAVGVNAWGYSSICHTTNGGGTWFRQGNRDTVGNVALAKISACNRKVVWVSGDEGTVLRTTDGGLTWQDRSPAGYSNVYLQGVTALDADIAWTAGSCIDGYAPILHTTNGGLSWARQSIGVMTNMASILSIGAADALRLWAVGLTTNPPNNGRVIGTTNGGMTWELQFDRSPGFHANELYVVNTAQVWVALDSSIIKTLDGGRTWEQAGSGSTPPYTMGVCVPDGRNVWASAVTGGRGYILNLPFGASDWIDQTPTNGIAAMSYVSLVRQADYSSMGTLAITVIPSNGIWTLRGPPVGYAGPLCGTGSLAAIQVPGGYYSASFAALPGFRAPSNQIAYVTPGQASVITGLYISRQPGDFDGDGKADPAAYQDGQVIVAFSGSGYELYGAAMGGAGGIECSADFDGDGKADPAVYNPTTSLLWVLFSSRSYALRGMSMGGAGCVPVVGDFDGDYKADPAIYVATPGLLVAWLSSLDYSNPRGASLGGAGWLNASADYDGDGKTDPAVYEPASGTWQALLSSHGYSSYGWTTAGGAGAVPVPGDYDGDGKADLMVYHPASGLWLCTFSGQNYTTTGSITGFGGPTMVARAGDYDSDGKADPAVYDPVTRTFYARLSGSGYRLAGLRL